MSHVFSMFTICIMLQLLNCYPFQPDSSIKTFWETFKEANNMEDVFSIQLCPPIDNPVHNRTELKDGIMVCVE